MRFSRVIIKTQAVISMDEGRNPFFKKEWTIKYIQQNSSMVDKKFMKSVIESSFPVKAFYIL